MPECITANASNKAAVTSAQASRGDIGRLAAEILVGHAVGAANGERCPGQSIPIAKATAPP